METEVLIVGAGPVGLALALELASQGHRCVVVEKNDRVGYAPRAKTTNVRTRELMRRWGIADRLAQQSPFGVNSPPNVVFATRMGGWELARFTNAFHCSPQRDERFSEHAQWIPQYKVEQVLQSRVAELPSAEILFSTAFTGFTQRDDGRVAVSLVRRGDDGTDESISIVARYLVGADGGRSAVREKLGVRMEGISPLMHHVSFVFRSRDLELRHRLGPALMYWLVNAKMPAVLSPLDSDGRWTFGCPAALAKGDPAELIRQALGFEVDLEILGRDEWTAHQLVATKYRVGSVFLAGDACHLHPPFGGFGMNMGIGDALDLGWKLAATLSGWGGPDLLDSYEIERRQIHQRVIAESVANHAVLSEHLAVDDIEAAGPAGDSVRSEVGARILATKRREFDSLGIVLGSRYHQSPLMLPGAGAQIDDDACNYRPSASAGCLAPHAWLQNGTACGASLYDHFSVSGLTLLITRQAMAGKAAAVVEAAAAQAIPLEILAPDCARLVQLYGCDFALIRPDQYIAWSGNSVEEACGALGRAAGRDSGAESPQVINKETTCTTVEIQ